MLLKRIYTCKDVDLLLAGKTILGSLKSNLPELSSVHNKWTPDYIESISKKIDESIGEFFKIDNKQELREVTSAIVEVQTLIIRDLSFLKATIENDFRKYASEILKKLGFNKYMKAVQKGSQNAMVQLLKTFRSSMTEALKNTIAMKGTNPDLINRIIGYANLLININPPRMIVNDKIKEITSEVIKSFNDLYLIIAEICKIATRYYQYDLLKKEQFIFNKVVRNIRINNIIIRESSSV